MAEGIMRTSVLGVAAAVGEADARAHREHAVPAIAVAADRVVHLVLAAATVPAHVMFPDVVGDLRGDSSISSISRTAGSIRGQDES